MRTITTAAIALAALLAACGPTPDDPLVNDVLNGFDQLQKLGQDPCDIYGAALFGLNQSKARPSDSQRKQLKARAAACNLRY